MFEIKNSGLAGFTLNCSHYRKSSTIVHYDWRSLLVYYGLYIIGLLFLVAMGVLAKEAYESYGLVESGRLAPHWQRMLIAAAIVAVPLLVIWGSVLYFHCWVTRLVICRAPQKEGLPKQMVLIQTLALIGFREKAVDIKELYKLRYNAGEDWVRESGQVSPYYLFNMSGRFLPFIIDAKGRVDQQGLKKLFS